MSWSNITKNAATFANTVKNILLGFLLKEDGYYLLLETGDRIILEESNLYSNSSKNSASYTNQTKNTS